MSIAPGNPALHFLCIDVDPSFIAMLLEKSDRLNISLDTCKTAQDARTKMEHASYEAYVIDLHVSEKTALDLVQDIRKKEGSKSSVAIIAGNYTEEESFKILRENGAVSYILEKPIDIRQFEGYILSVNQRFAPPPTLPMNAGPSSGKLDILKRKYEQSITEKMELLTTLIRGCEENPDIEHFSELKNAVHKIGGSAGSYGFTEVSTLCKEMDTQISERLATGTLKDKEWIATLPIFLRKFGEGFKTTQKGEGQLFVEEVKPHNESTIYVIDHEIKLLESLEFDKDEYPIDLTLESDPSVALDRIRSGQFNPEAIVVAQTFPLSHITGFDIINIQRQRLTAKPTVFAMILEQENIDTRMEAMKRGINYIFHRPVNPNMLLKVLHEALQVKNLEDYKVLVLDDDTDFCSYVTIVLTEIGVSVRTISDPKDLFGTLEEYNPQVLILDLVMPRYDGLNLLKSLRQDVAYTDLIVLVVTSSEESSTRLSVYSAKADDILYKPLDVAVLQTRILNFVERQKFSLKQPSSGDNSSLYNLKALAMNIKSSLVKSGRHMQYLTLFEIDNFTDLLMQKGHSSIKDIQAYINGKIEVEFSGSAVSFNYNSSKFALIFEEGDPVILEKRMFDFLSILVKEHTKEKLVFNCCILPISKKFSNTSQILHVANECLNQASNQEPASVRIVVLTAESIVQSNKLVILVDSDKELLKILKAAFEARGILVQTYTEGETVLKDMLALDSDHIPSLFIVERKLIDMDGLDLIIKINDHFDTTVPFYILSIFSSDKDVSEGLKQGALEYIGKPFNLTILMQKAMKSIFK